MTRQKLVFSSILIALALILNACSTNTYAGRWLLWNASEIDDFTRFPNYPYQASATPFYFEKAEMDGLDDLQVPKNDKKNKRLLDLLEDGQTTAFLVIRNDTILYERYLNDYHRHSMNTSFSVAKSITSFMIGKAIDDGLIKSRTDQLTTYLPQLSQTDKRYEEVTIANLLDMRSGIQFKDTDLIWGDKPKAYYHPNLRKHIEAMPIRSKPGAKFKYNPYNTIIAGMLIEATSSQQAAAYFEEHIWNKLGMEYSGSWSLDSEESKMTKMESGLNLRAIDFAKFGRLILQKGRWGEEQILSKAWMEDCFKIDESLKLADYGDEIYYKNFWWIYSSKPPSPDIIAGWGHLGQYLYVFPKTNTIMVRMGKKKKGPKSWGRLFQEIHSHISTSAE